jgi:hypothetical protein
VTPIEAAEREVQAELKALERRIGSAPVPDAVTIRVEFDRQTQMPRVVECHEERGRRVCGGEVGSRRGRSV